MNFREYGMSFSFAKENAPIQLQRNKIFLARHGMVDKPGHPKAILEPIGYKQMRTIGDILKQEIATIHTKEAQAKPIIDISTSPIARAYSGALSIHEMLFGSDLLEKTILSDVESNALLSGANTLRPLINANIANDFQEAIHLWETLPDDELEFLGSKPKKEIYQNMYMYISAAQEKHNSGFVRNVGITHDVNIIALLHQAFPGKYHGQVFHGDYVSVAPTSKKGIFELEHTDKLHNIVNKGLLLPPTEFASN